MPCAAVVPGTALVHLIPGGPAAAKAPLSLPRSPFEGYLSSNMKPGGSSFAGLHMRLLRFARPASSRDCVRNINLVTHTIDSDTYNPSTSTRTPSSHASS